MALPTLDPRLAMPCLDHGCSCKACCFEFGNFAGFTHVLNLTSTHPTELKFCGMLMFVLLQVFWLAQAEVKVLALASIHSKHLSQALPYMRQQPAP